MEMRRLSAPPCSEDKGPNIMGWDVKIGIEFPTGIDLADLTNAVLHRISQDHRFGPITGFRIYENRRAFKLLELSNDVNPGNSIHVLEIERHLQSWNDGPT